MLSLEGKGGGGEGEETVCTAKFRSEVVDKNGKTGRQQRNAVEQERV